MADTTLNAFVSQRIEVSPYLIILRVAPDGWELPDFTPGQFAALALPGSAPRYRYTDPEETTPDPDKLIKRAYSIASSSVDREYVEFYITLVRSGELTPRLFALEVGDRVWLSKKFPGTFKLSEAPDDVNVVFAATGTGLAPYMSMLRTDFESNATRRVAVLHGASHSWDLGYRAELVTMERLCKNFTYLPVISRPEDEPVTWSGPAGHLQDLWSGDTLDRLWGGRPTPSDTHIFLCGNPLMIEGMIEVLSKEGFTEQTKKAAGTIHLERFWT